MTPAVNIRALRINQGWTLAVAAEKFAITESALSMIERGLRSPGPKAAAAIASAYGYQATDIWPIDPIEPQAKAAA